MTAEISRRRFLAAASLLPLAAAVSPRLVEWLGAAKAAAASGGFAFFDDHQAAVVREATARLIPGPSDDVSELGHPGAREANVVGFIDTMLGAFSFSTPKVHAGGPWSNRNTSPTSPDFMATFVPLTRVQTMAWKKRLADFQQQYAAGIDRYDAAARSAGASDFASAPPTTQDSILMQDTSGFRDLLFTHAIEGMYAVPEYGGNAGTPPVGWQDVKFRGDTQPVGWSDAQVSNPDGPDPIILDGIIQGIAANFESSRWRSPRGGVVAGNAIVIGSGPGGSIAAWILASAGWNVTIFEKGPNYFGDLTTPSPPTQFSNDELKEARFFDEPDWEQSEPRTYYRQSDDQSGAPRVTGFVNQLPTNVGGGTVHWDAKTPRFWDIDFKKRSTPGLGPVPGADVQDWPLAYADLAPYFDAVEQLIGVQGDLSALQSAPTYAHHPQSAFAMPPGPGEYGSLKASAAARSLGLHPFPTPMAINSVQHDGRPACNNCGFCSGYGCPIHARVGALAPLRRAMQTGRVQVRANSFVSRVNWSNRRATNVTYVDPNGRQSTQGCNLVVLAASAIETARLALLSGLPDPHGLIGRDLMFHWFTDAIGVFFGERIHANRGRSTTHDLEDYADPDFPGARAAAAANGLPYMRGGILEIGGTQELIAEGLTYQFLLQTLAPEKLFGASFKQLMRASPLRDRLLGIQMIAEDLAQPDNRVTLDPTVKDVYGQPVARVTYSPHRHEQAAQRFYMPQLVAILKAAGADLAAAVPAVSTPDFPVAQGDAPSGAHIMGGMRTGTDPAISVCDPNGRIHDLDNVFVTDASLFVTSGAVNPTLTLMAVALRNAVAFSGLGTIPAIT